MLRTPFAPAALAPVEAVLTPSARVTIGDVPVIDGTMFVTMRGVVRDASGKPATGARVSISAVRDPKVDSPVRWAEVVAEALGIAAAIAAHAPGAVRAAKRAVRAAAELALGEGVAAERRAFAGLFGTADQREGMAAFLEKRPPTWTGR